jgi:hypothetical protein
MTIRLLLILLYNVDCLAGASRLPRVIRAAALTVGERRYDCAIEYEPPQARTRFRIADFGVRI